MKHLFLLTFTLGIFSLNAQHEAYFKTADNIEHSANRSTVMMAMAENLPNFKMVTGAPQVLDSVYVMEADKRIPEAFELLQFVSSEEKRWDLLQWNNKNLFITNKSQWKFKWCCQYS